MRRREFIIGLLLAGSEPPHARVAIARDATKIPRIGYLGTNIGPPSLPPPNPEQLALSIRSPLNPVQPT
jgi:hypothetical protein